MEKTEYIEQMRDRIDQIIEAKENLKNAEEQERFWRSEATSIRNRINTLQQSGRKLSEEVFGK